MNTYAEITTLDEYGDTKDVFIEPLSVEHISIVLEEVLGDLDIGESILIDIVEMETEEYESRRQSEGY